MARKGQNRKPKVFPGDPNDPKGFHVLIQRYLHWLEVHNYSRRTRTNREDYLGRFLLWCEQRDLVQPSEITKPILERYQRWLYAYRMSNGKPLSFVSQNHYLSSVRALFKWLSKQNLILYNPASELELPKKGYRLPVAVLSAEEAEQVLAVPEVAKPLGLRDRAILEVLYSTGIRRMELVNLRLWDLDAERGTLVVRQGKGKKDRVVPIGERALAWVNRYLEEVRPSLVLGADDGTLFLTNVGEAFSPARMSQLARRHVQRSGVGKSGACHLFRHTLATLMLEGGADLRYIQQMLGHASPESTQIYTRVTIGKLKTIHEATHPGARLGRRVDDSAVEEVEAMTAAELLAEIEAEVDDEGPEGS